MPDSMTVGSESNVMFGINNTGKVILYNVTVTFEGDSIKPTDTYVGNIKPGETGNVDTMLTGIAPTEDDGTIRVLINYEDETGVAAEPEEKELTLFVTEDVPMDWEIDPADNPDTEEPSFIRTYRLPMIGGGILLLAAAAGIALHIKKKRKAAKEEEIDDEIS
jgi:hypothetical protein